MRSNQFALLATKRFLPLFITQFLGAFNDNVFKNALVILITYRLAAIYHENAQILVTLGAGFFILPFFLFSATAGQLADKYRKAYLIRIVKFVEIVLMALAALGFFLQNVTLLMGVLFLIGTQATFFGPLKYAILPEQLRADELIAGNGLIEAGTFVAVLLGTICGGLLILTAHGDYWISAAIIALALGGLLSSWFIPDTHFQDTTLRVQYNFMVETVRVMNYSRHQQEIFVTIIGISWFWLLGATFLAELPVFAKDVLSTNAQVFTLFVTSFTVGIALGSMLCNKLLRGQIRLTYVFWAALGMSLFILDLFFAAEQVKRTEIIGLKVFLSTFNGWHIVADLVLMAMCGGIYTVPLYAYMQQRSPQSYRARIVASNNIMNALFMLVSVTFTVVMLKWGYTVNQVFLVIGIANIFIAFYMRRVD